MHGFPPAVQDLRSSSAHALRPVARRTWRCSNGACLPGARISPGIATHCPRPSRAGEEAEGRAGWGFQIPRRGRRRGVLLPPGYLRRAPPSIPTRGRGSSQKRTEKIRSSSRTYSTFSRSSERSPERSTVKKSPPDGSAMVKFIVVSTCTVPSATVISST